MPANRKPGLFNAVLLLVYFELSFITLCHIKLTLFPKFLLWKFKLFVNIPKLYIFVFTTHYFLLKIQPSRSPFIDILSDSTQIHNQLLAWWTIFERDPNTFWQFHFAINNKNVNQVYVCNYLLEIGISKVMNSWYHNRASLTSSTRANLVENLESLIPTKEVS